MSDLAAVEEKVQYLQDLFQRKLLEDRAKNQLIDAVQKSLAERDAIASGDAFRDLFKEALLALDRLRSEQPDRELNESVIDELLEVFARRGLRQVPNEGHLDPRLHEVIETVPSSDEHPAGRIVYVEREGFVLGDRLLRPARVVVAAGAASVAE